MEEKKFRNKVGWFQFLCCAMVIWSHAGNAELFLGKAGKNHWLSRLEYVHFPAVMGVSIPCFFMILGYLFFRFFTFDQLKEKYPTLGEIQAIRTDGRTKEDIAILFAKELIKRYK